jgi:tetratricopeptide (TPR) repeat protein
MTSIITRADRARDIRQWELAARLYRKALNRNPKNPPIWLQYGHVLKESGKPTEAESAYRIAIGYQPGASDAHLHLGHVLKLRGKRCDAEAAYLRALAIDPMLPEPLEELRRLGWSNAHLAELKQAVEPKPSYRYEVAAPIPSTPAPEREPLHPRVDSDVDPMLWFFVGDTIDWLQSHEQLTGDRARSPPFAAKPEHNSGTSSNAHLFTSRLCAPQGTPPTINERLIRL